MPAACCVSWGDVRSVLAAFKSQFISQFSIASFFFGVLSAMVLHRLLNKSCFASCKRPLQSSTQAAATLRVPNTETLAKKTSAKENAQSSEIYANEAGDSQATVEMSDAPSSVPFARQDSFKMVKCFVFLNIFFRVYFFLKVLLIRTDINMGKGKVAAQCCHAALSAHKHALRHAPNLLSAWEADGQAKVTLRVTSETELNALLDAARRANLIAVSIRDAGRTQVISGTKTVGAIGPGPAKLIDCVTGHLKLY